MSPRSLIALAGSAALLASCSNKSEAPPLTGQVAASKGASSKLYQDAKQADNAGKRDSAIKLYGEAADRAPNTTESIQARYREAQLLEQKGDNVKAFEAYQKFIDHDQASNLYSKALASQANIAQAAANGSIQTSFLGLKSGLPLEKIVGMLETVRNNAPKSPTAARAQFTIGDLNHKRKKDKESIEAYRKVVRDFPDSSEAPEAEFRIGKVYMEEAQSGNQNQATLNLAHEAFQDYLNQYPNHSKAGEARRLMSELGGRTIQRSFDVAEFYLKTGEKESAKVYYREVMHRASSGPLYQKAKARLAELGEH